MDDSDLQDLTRRYSRYARTAAGLGNVLGGALLVLVYAAAATLAPTLWLRLLAAASPLVWIAVKQALRSRYYQRFGQVTERLAPWERWFHLGLTAFTGLTAAAIFGFVISRVVAGTDLSISIVAYLGYVIAMPFLVWFFMRSVIEFLVGVPLLAQAAVVTAGGHYPLSLWSIYFLAWGMMAIVVGLKEHAEHRSIARQLGQIRSRA